MSDLGPGNEKQADAPAREAPPDATPEFYGPAKMALWLGLAAWACLAVNAALGGSPPFFLLGIAVAIAGVIVAIAGVIVGIVAVRAVGKSRGWLTGKGSAIAGIYISGAYIVIMVAFAAMLLPALGRARAHARKVRCSINLQQIGVAAHMWLIRLGPGEGRPPSLEKLLAGGFIDDEAVLICPASKTTLVPGEFVTDYETLFDRVDFKIRRSMIRPRLPMAWDNPGNHPDGSNIVYFDNPSAEFVSEERFRELMKQVDAWIEKNRPTDPR